MSSALLSNCCSLSAWTSLYQCCIAFFGSVKRAALLFPFYNHLEGSISCELWGSLKRRPRWRLPSEVGAEWRWWCYSHGQLQPYGGTKGVQHHTDGCIKLLFSIRQSTLIWACLTVVCLSHVTFSPIGHYDNVKYLSWFIKNSFKCKIYTTGKYEGMVCKHHLYRAVREKMCVNVMWGEGIRGQWGSWALLMRSAAAG